jgi:beta-fructofuranosidase
MEPSRFRRTEVSSAGLGIATLAFGVALAACGAPVLAHDGDVMNGEDASGGADGSCGFVPRVAGNFTRVYQPSGGRYLNDHTIVSREENGRLTWHVFGITNTGTGNPQTEHAFLHATAPALLGPWTDQPDALTVDSSLNEVVLWAPYVWPRADATWTMYYWAGWITEETPLRGLRRADSTDLASWRRYETTSDPTRRPPGGRDPMLFHDGDRWLLYSVGGEGPSGGVHGQIVVSVSADPDDPSGWSEPTSVITDPDPSYDWGNLESPFVLRYAGQYYLFLTRTGTGDGDYVRTNVFRSDDPLHFAWQPLTTLHSHAAEIVVDQDHYFITSAGWPAVIGSDNVGLSIAPLEWSPQSPCP